MPGGKLLQLGESVARDPVDRVAGTLQRGEIVAEIAGLGGAPGGVGLGVEVEDHLVAAEAGEGDGGAVLVEEGEIRGRLTGFEACGVWHEIQPRGT